MDASAWVSLGGAVASGIFSAIAIVYSARTKNIAMGQAETTLRQNISNTRREFATLSVQISTVRDGKRDTELTKADERRLEPLEAALRAAVEDNLTAYDDACSKYIDGKIDRVRFRKSYEDEIVHLCRVKEGLQHELMNPSESCRFQTIWAVYRQWKHLD